MRRKYTLTRRERQKFSKLLPRHILRVNPAGFGTKINARPLVEGVTTYEAELLECGSEIGYRQGSGISERIDFYNPDGTRKFKTFAQIPWIDVETWVFKEQIEIGKLSHKQESEEDIDIRQVLREQMMTFQKRLFHSHEAAAYAVRKTTED